MEITINGRTFWVFINEEEIILSLLMNNQEYILIDGTSGRWTAQQLYDRIENYSDMGIDELLKCVKYISEDK